MSLINRRAIELIDYSYQDVMVEMSDNYAALVNHLHLSGYTDVVLDRIETRNYALTLQIQINSLCERLILAKAFPFYSPEVKEGIQRSISMSQKILVRVKEIYDATLTEAA